MATLGANAAVIVEPGKMTGMICWSFVVQPCCLAGTVCLERLQKIDKGGQERVSNRCFTRALAQISNVAEQRLDERDLLDGELLLIQCFGSVDFRRVRV